MITSQNIELKIFIACLTIFLKIANFNKLLRLREENQIVRTNVSRISTVGNRSITTIDLLFNESSKSLKRTKCIENIDC